MMDPSVEEFYKIYRDSVAFGADMELRLRMLADKTPAIATVSTARNMETVEKAILNHFGNEITDDERKLLRVARQLRNKLIHGDFTSAVGKLDELGYAPRAAKIYKVKPPAPLTKERLGEAVAKAEPFAVDKTPNTGHLVPWHLQLCLDGSLAKAAEIFRRGISIIDRLALS